MTTPLFILPSIVVEVGMVPDSPVQATTAFKLGDATYAQLGTGTLGTSIQWSDVSADVNSFTINRPATRQQGPLWNYQASTISILLDNSNSTYDPDNISGPFYGQLSAMVPVRVRTVFGSGAYGMYSGFADGWFPADVTYAGDYAELTLAATDAFKVLANVNLATVTVEGVNADTGARVKDILTRAGWYTSAERLKIDTGNSLLQGTTLGADALSLMQLAVDSELGQLYVDGTGAVVFRARHAILSDTRSNVVQAVFGDKPKTLTPEAIPMAVLNSNSGFNGTISPWTAANNSTLSYDTTYQYGTKPGALAFHGDGSTANPQTNSEFVTVSPSTLYTAFVTTYVPTGSGIQAKIDWFDSGQSFISGTSFSLQADTDIWNVLVPSGTSPVSAAFAKIAIQSNSTPAVGTMFYVGYAGIVAGDTTSSSFEMAMSSYTRANDDTIVVNDVQATRVGGTLQEVQDAVSIAKFIFPRSYPRSDLILQNDSDSLNWAQWVLYIGKSTSTRIDSIKINPLADPYNLWPQVLGREIGDRIQVWVRPPLAGEPIVRDCFIMGITHDWNTANSQWITTYTLQDASKYGSFLTLGNSTLGQLGSNALAF